MKTIVILYPTELANDAEHAMGAFEEELDMHRVSHHSIGKEIIQTQTARFVFRDVYQPTKQNRFKQIDKLYIVKSIMNTKEVDEYATALQTDWLRMPTSGMYDYLQDIESEIDREKVVRYEVEGTEVKKVHVESYKADRTGYFTIKEDAEIVAEKKKQAQLEKEKLQTNALNETKRKPRRKKKDIEEPMAKGLEEQTELVFI